VRRPTSPGRAAAGLLAWTLAGCATTPPPAVDPPPSAACELLRTGTPARAIVLDQWETGMVDGDAIEVELTVRVLPEEGEAFEAVARLALSPFVLPQVEPGRFVPVRFDPADPAQVAIDLADCPGEGRPGGEE
jgi:hypothetical protein